MNDPRLLLLMRHAEFADAAVWKAILRSGAASDDRVLDLMHHIHAVQRAFHAVWTDGEVDFGERATVGDTEALVGWGREGHRQLQRYVESADEEELVRQPTIPWAHYFERRFGRPMEPVSVGDMIQQVAMHSIHHRGQVTSRLRELEAEPPLVDWIAWLWLDRPIADWE